MPKVIVVGSTNPVKVDAVMLAAKDMYTDEGVECSGVSAQSEVPDQVSRVIAYCLSVHLLCDS